MSPHNNTQSPTSVLIIGAGVAGLSAALELQKKGIPFLILEGRDRIGGRIHTVQIEAKDNNVADVDMGAAWVDGGPEYNSVYRLAEKEGLELKPAPYMENSLEIGRQHRVWDSIRGKWMNWFGVNTLVFKNARAVVELEKPLAPEEQAKFDNLQERMEEILAKRWRCCKGPYDQLIMEAPQVLMFGAQMSETHPNANDPDYFKVKDDYWKGTEYMIKGGYQKLVELLSKDLNIEKDVLLDQTVTKVSASANGVEVQTTTGSIHQGTHVVVTVPLGILKANKIQWDPPLPKTKQDAIHRFGFGNLEKVALTFPTPFWRADPKRRQNVVYASQDMRFPAFMDVTDTAGAPTLVAQPARPEAQLLVQEHARDAVKEVTSMLQIMFAKEYQEPISTRSSNWKNDPFTLGSYSLLGRQTRPGDIEALAEPHADNRILFGGEATSNEYTGYVEGGMLSGKREAKRLLSMRG